MLNHTNHIRSSDVGYGLGIIALPGKPTRCPHRGSQILVLHRSFAASPLRTTTHNRPTCVEDAGSKGGRCRLVQEQLPHHHPGGIPRKPPLQEPHPEVTEVTMETESDHGDIPCAVPVNFLPPRKPLVGQVPAGEQATVERDVTHPRETTDVFQKRRSHVCNVTDTVRR